MSPTMQVVPILASFLMASSSSFAQGVAVYHSSDDSGVNPGPGPVVAMGTTTLHLYIDAGSIPSAGSDPCCAGQGDEVLGWNLKLGAVGGITISSVAPTPSVIVNQTPTRLHFNGGHFQLGDLGPTKLADVVVQASGSGALSLLRGEIVGPSLGLEGVGPRMIASAPEPALDALLALGTAGLFGLVRIMRRGRS